MAIPTVDPPTFYMTAVSGNADIPQLVAATGAPAMGNAVQHHGETGFSDFDGFQTPYVIDSGGYSAMDTYGGEFPWTVREYHEWLADIYDRNPFDWAAVMDFACEPAFDDLLSVRERMDRTLDNTIAHFDLDPEYPVLPVLQGRTINDYLTYYDWLSDHGIPTDYVGLGTVCRLSSSNELARVEEAVRANTDIEHLHGFGVKISSFNCGATFDTADSHAWSWKLMFGQEYYIDGNDDDGIPRLQARPYGDADDCTAARHQSFVAYYRRASALQERAYRLKNGTPTSLTDYV